MAANKRSDLQQIVQACLDVDEQALKVLLAATSLEMELSASDGDSVTAHRVEVAEKETVEADTVTGTVVVAAVSIASINTLQLVTNTTEALTATTPLVTLELSPSATDDVWIASSLTVTPSAGTGPVAGTSITNNTYLRARVVLTHGGYTAGSFDVYLNGRG